ncbi:MAG TPA: ABC transporter permease [Thermomicrobiales bacterium]|jgi:molybdate transport system permease protein|nr:molybdate ABC transporter permease subunit [Chloroflexota bacterium]HQZ89145.1 ABC transporter permease [Thermomicrobiales bacterium]HRA32174.1 ABC transporter permease [Thermomicrobiales bacterium]
MRETLPAAAAPVERDDALRPASRLSLFPPARAALIVASLALLVFLGLPIAAIFIRGVPSGALSRALDDPIVHQALTLSLITTSVTLLASISVGTPVAYLLARYRFRGHQLLDTLVDLPMVLPPAVAGVALLMAFGRRGVAGPFLSGLGIEIPFTTLAVILAQTFVAAPFFVRSARAGFESVDSGLEEIAATLGASRLTIFRTVTVPLALPALLGGAVMAWARALGEFGATLMFAGNFAGRTQTMPLAIYETLESGRLDATLALSIILVVVSFSVLLLFKLLVRHGGGVAATEVRPRA